MTEPAPQPRETRQQLLMSALSLFAERGIEAVSLRAINQAAGSRNASAVHYHFGDKLGIVEAVIQLVRKDVASYRDPALDRLEERSARGDHPSCREIIAAPFGAYWSVYRDLPHGHDAILFCARQNLEAEGAILELFQRLSEKQTQRFMALLERALPHVPPDVLELRFLVSHILMLQSLVGLARANPGCLDENENPRPDVVDHVLDYLVAGLSGPVEA